MDECTIVINSAKDLWEWSKKELEYIPKPLLLKYMGHRFPLELTGALEFTEWLHQLKETVTNVDER